MDDVYVSANRTLHELFGVSEVGAKEIRNRICYRRGVITDPEGYVENLKAFLANPAIAPENVWYATYFAGYLHGVADCVINAGIQVECEE